MRRIVSGDGSTTCQFAWFSQRRSPDSTRVWAAFQRSAVGARDGSAWCWRRIGGGANLRPVPLTPSLGVQAMAPS
jgi:hypothetical protein